MPKPSHSSNTKQYGESKIIKKDQVHFTPLGYKQQASFIAGAVKKITAIK